MSFAKTLYELRKRRRLPMTFWEPEISSAFINDIEKKGLIPRPEKLGQLASTIMRVAREQGATDPDDERVLWRERDRSLFVERLSIDADLADAFVSLGELARERELDPEGKEKLLGTIKEVAETVAGLDAVQQAEFIEVLGQTVEGYSSRVRAGQVPAERDREFQATR